MRSIIAGTLAGGLFLSSAGVAAAAPPEWQISEASGAVTVARAGLVKAAVRGGALRPGDVVRTGRRSRAVLIRGGEYLVVSPASEIQIAQPEASGNGLMQIIENVGSVLFRIEKKTTPHFGVRTPYMAAVVKGTIFTVTVDREGTALKVSEGAVEVSTLDDGAREIIRPGMVGRILAGDTAALRVFDGVERVIRSGEGGTAPVVATEVAAVAREQAAPPAEIATIAEPISENPVNLAMVTNGLVSGDSSFAALVAVEARTAPTPVNGPGSSGATPPVDVPAVVDQPSGGVGPQPPAGPPDTPTPADHHPASPDTPTPPAVEVPPVVTTPPLPPQAQPPVPPVGGAGSNSGSNSGSGSSGSNSGSGGSGSNSGSSGSSGSGSNSGSSGSSGGSNASGPGVAIVDGNLVVTVNGDSYVFGRGKGKDGKGGGK